MTIHIIDYNLTESIWIRRYYANKQQLLNEINKTAKLFIDEFNSLSELQKNVLVTGIDRTSTQMIAYQF